MGDSYTCKQLIKKQYRCSCGGHRHKCDILRIEELEAALKSLADDDWWDMETPSTAADFAKAALQHQRMRHDTNQNSI